jgi:hypothetical protein
MLYKPAQDHITEEESNLENAKWAVVDDFSVEESNPLWNKTIHRITGRGLITAHRKYAHVRSFQFHGQLVLTCNGFWKPAEPLANPDHRRLTAVIMKTQFVDGKTADQLAANERIKDPTIKDNPQRFRPELSFLVLAYHHIRQAWSLPSGHPSGEVILPRPPSAVEYRERMFAEHMNIDIADLVATFFRERMVEWVPGRGVPSTYSEFREALRAYAEQVSMRILPNQLDDALRATNIDEANRKAPGTGSRGSNKFCATVAKDGPRTVVVKKWTLAPPTPSIFQQLNTAAI